MHNRKAQITTLLSLATVVAIFHFLTPTAPHTSHVVHIVLRKLYFLPPVMAGAWFGLRGAVLTTLTVSIAFTVHIFLDWPGNYMEQANQLGELASFWVVGLIPGFLFDRQRSLLEKLARAHEETLLALVSALDMREKNTRLHSQRVRDFTLLLADKYGVTEKQRRVIGLAALLHDVGKIAVPDSILLKRSGLSEPEWEEMQRHPEEGYKLLHRIAFLKEAAEIVHTHHEHYDGTGYPQRLKGEAIPLGARLFAVADVFDALTSDRPYHTAMDYDQAVEIIRQNNGTHFEPAAVEVFEKIRPAEWMAIAGRYSDRKSM